MVYSFLEPESATTSWGYEDGPWKGPGPPLLVAADFYNCLVVTDSDAVSSERIPTLQVAGN